MGDFAPQDFPVPCDHAWLGVREARIDPYVRFNEPDLISDEDLGLLQIGIDTDPDKPGGQIVFDTADYATEEEAMKAMEALFLSERDDELSAQDWIYPRSAPRSGTLSPVSSPTFSWQSPASHAGADASRASVEGVSGDEPCSSGHPRFFAASSSP